MFAFCVKMAELPIGVNVQFTYTKRFLSRYISEEDPVFSIETTPEDVDYEREQAALQDQADGRPITPFSDPYLETQAVLRKIADRIYAYDGLLFHGAAIALGGRAYIFTAPSGTGKTTHVRLWLQRFPEARVLNGDKPFLRLLGDQVLACGNPWQGKENYGTGENLPLGGLCLLERGEENRIVSLTLRDAIGTLLRQTHLPADTAAMLRTIQIIGELGHRVPLYRLWCNMDPEAAAVSAGAMLEWSPQS